MKEGKKGQRETFICKSYSKRRKAALDVFRALIGKRKLVFVKLTNEFWVKMRSIYAAVPQLMHAPYALSVFHTIIDIRTKHQNL